MPWPRTDMVTAGGRTVPLAQVYATILTVVARDAAQRREPASPSRLILTVPAGSAGREFAALHAAAQEAGLPVPEFVAKPLAAACYLAADTSPGQCVAILDVGGGSIGAAVLRRTQDGFEFAGEPGGLARVTDDEPALTLRQGTYELLATIAAAGLTPSQLTAIHVTGEASQTLQATDLITQILSTKPHLAPNSQAAAVLGALDARNIAHEADPSAMAFIPSRSETTASATAVDSSAGTVSPHGPSRRTLLIASLGLGSVAAVGLGADLLRTTRRPPVALPIILKGITDGVTSVVFSPDGKTLAVGGADSKVRLWDMTAPRITASRTIKLPFSSEVNTMSVSPDSTTLAVAGNWVFFYDLATGQMHPAALKTAGDIACAAFSPDGKTIAGGCSDYTVRLWEVATRRPIAALTGLADYIVSVAFSPDGKIVAGCSYEEAQIWDVATRRATATLKPTASSDAFVVFSPDGKTLVSGGGDTGLAPHRAIDLWDVATGHHRAAIILPGHTFGVTSVVFTPDGRTIIGAGAPVDPVIDAGSGMPSRGAILQWDIATRQTIAVVPAPAPTGPLDINSGQYLISALALSPDGRILAAGGSDGTVHLLSTSASKLKT